MSHAKRPLDFIPCADSADRTDSAAAGHDAAPPTAASQDGAALTAPTATTADVFEVTLQPQGWRFEAPADQSLLLAALDMGLRLPHSCRNGTCRACIARLTSGRIAYRIEWPGLSREEKDEGWILPCVACARSDLVLEAPAAINLFEVEPSGSTTSPTSATASPTAQDPRQSPQVARSPT